MNKRGSELHPMDKLSAKAEHSAAKQSTMKTNNPTERSRLLDELLRERILVLDGAMGTMLQRADIVGGGFRRPCSWKAATKIW